jgi:glycosyltransferase involved in cell wall biosynthesis
MSLRQFGDELVTVVIPTYNRPNFLRGAIETVISQNYRPIEIIVVDDGSDFQYADDIASDFDKDITIVNHGSNKGLSAARNSGINESSGSYIAFLDDDDRWRVKKLTRQIKLFQNDSIGIVTCLVAATTRTGDLIHYETTAPSGDCSDKLLVCNEIGTPSRVLVRRDAIEDVGTFDESLSTKQDWDFYIRICQNWQVGAVQDHLCFRTVHESMSSSPNSSRRDNNIILDKHENLIRRRGLWSEAKSEIADRVGTAYLKNGELKIARQHLSTSVSTESTTRRRILLLLSYTHPYIITKLTKIKRKLLVNINKQLNSDPDLSEVPGLHIDTEL